MGNKLGDKMYVRLCEGLNDYGKLIPQKDNIYNYIKNQKKDYYVSVYAYNEKQKKMFDEKKSVAGMRDVTTNKIIFDFDSKDISKAQKDALKLIERINTTKSPLFKTLNGTNTHIDDSNCLIYFSGGKGFHIVLDTVNTFEPKLAKQIAVDLAGDLPTFDSVVYNPNRILRVAYTKHPKSGLYKIPLTLDELRTLSIDEIKNYAKEEYSPEPINQNILEFSVENYEETFKHNEHRIEDSTMESTLLSDLNLAKRPKNLSPWKYALEQGFFPSGQRSNALMILAATYKSLGYSDTKCYYALKAATDLQSQRSGQDKFSKDEIWNNIINVVYAPQWEGGTYAEDTFPEQIKKYLIDLGVPRQDEENLHENFVVNIDRGFDSFAKYAENIDENTMRFGIEDLDNALRVQVGHLIGILAGPGIGKCHAKGTQILLHNGTVANVEDIKVGDLLMGDDSTPRKVLSLARGKEQLYRIHTDDSYYDVNESHILSLRTTRQLNSKQKNEIINISVKDYLEKSDHFKRRTMGYRVPIDFKETQIEFDPYLVGSWIGDGSKGKPELTHNDDELCEHYNKIAQASGLIYRKRVNPEKATTHIFKTKDGQTNPFYDFIRERCVKNNEKCIPENYIINSREKRLQLLAGLIDTDGYYDYRQDWYEYTCKEKKLAKQIRFLCRSLGLKCTMKKTIKRIKKRNFEGTYYRLYIKGDLTKCPILLERKKQVKKEVQRVPTNYRIKVEKLKVDDYYGFEIDGNHLYCLADCSVTHNTSMALTLLNNTSKEGVKSFFASYDMAGNILIQKLVQRQTGLSTEEVYDVYRKQDQKEITRFKNVLNKNFSNVSFCFKAGQNINELRDSIKREEMRLGEEIKLVIVDYLELVRTKSSDPTQSSAEAIQGLREIANEGKVVVCLLQPNKLSSTPDEPLLTYNAAKGSSAIAQAVTAMITCHRPGYNPDDPEDDNFFSINIVKNRMGPLGKADFAWEGVTGKITELEDIQKQALGELRALKKAEKSSKDDF